MHRVWLASLGLIGLSVPATAVDADPFDPSASLAHGAGTPAVDSPTLTEAGPSAGVFATIGENLVLLETDADPVRLVPHAFATNLYGGWTFEDKLRIDVLAPVYWHTRVATDEPFSGTALGDVLVQANIRLRENDAETFAVSLLPAIGLPTGRQKALVARGLHMKLRGAVGGLIEDRVGYAANAGFVLQRGRSFEDIAVGSSIVGSAGVWVHADDHFRVGADYDLSLGTSNAPGFANNLATAHLFAQMTSDEGVGVTVGAGRGLSKGVGAPDWRIFAAVTWARILRDADGDKIPDKEDACPLDPEDFDSWEDLDGCPEVDNDEDTILDIDDGCPNEAEDFDDWEDLDGCPDPDNDSDGILDVNDLCPIDAGLEALEGCPDTDADGLADLVDQCPADPGPVDLIGCPDGDADQIPDFRDACPDVPRLEDEPLANSNGCPRKAFVSGDRIQITERVLFQTGKAVIREESFPLLDSVVEAFQDYPEIEAVEVAGHTDNVGSERYNLGLSRRRAAAVRTYLTGQGIDPDRLTSKGYGETEPISNNFTESGRQANRRVEFRISGQAESTKEVSTNLGRDRAGITVNLPAGSPFTVVELDGEVTSPRATFESLIVEPGDHTVRVTDPARQLDFSTDITVPIGSTIVVDVPADAIGKPDGRTIVDLPAIAPPLPDGAPLAVPEGAEVPDPSGDAPDPTGAAPEPAAEGAEGPPEGTGDAPPADGASPTDTAEPSDIDLGTAVPDPESGGEDLPELTLPSAATPDALDSGIRTPRVTGEPADPAAPAATDPAAPAVPEGASEPATPEGAPEGASEPAAPEGASEPAPTVVAPDGGPWGSFAEPAAAAEPAPLPVGTVDDPWGAASPAAPVDDGPSETRATSTAPAATDTAAPGPADTGDGVIVGPGFDGSDADPAAEKAQLRAEKKAAKAAARDAKAAAKAAKKAERAGEEAPPPLVDPATLPGGSEGGSDEPSSEDDPWSQDD